MHEMLHILNPKQADWYEFQISSQKESSKKWTKTPDLSVCMLRIGYHQYKSVIFQYQGEIK